MRYRVIFFCLPVLLSAQLLWAAPAQRTFSDWQVTCNNQNFCVARNTGEHHGLVMTLSRSAGARTDAVLRIDRGGLVPPDAKEAAIAPRLLLDGKPLSFNSPHWRVSPWHLMTGDPATIAAFLQTIQDAQAITLKNGVQTLSLVGLKAALLFIDAQQKRVGSETAWIEKGNEPPLSVPPAPALKGIAVINPTPVPLSEEERNDLLDYAAWRVNGIRCSLDPLRREAQVSALTDDNALLIVNCEAGAYNTIDLAWIVSRKKTLVSRAVRLRLPFNRGVESNDMELMNAFFDEKTRELVTLAKGRGLADCGIQTRWRYDGDRFRLVRYAEEPSCDNWHGPDAWPTLWITR
ncbi:DUF1176 domain-containing protein [Salmonella enterica]|uniref:DUF1176 domain-containing protein n=3 Tax=Salmonella enterica TaxID=28901 RepID=A0A735RE43_SALDZ|nr:DUF1176 domain-containing protein [Salmonella enterica]EBP3537539.1 DUF1176 domain-containing protein [Salmonella enterica subsp. enterica]EBQ4835250.1 DUF1176 domain-containing protein [Salmonella enterica subsp. arizonae]EBW1591027.1 DUF1176 domain-containing protein [Salmonella enterica subsp. diarizonae serovar 61:r:z]EDN4535896.1 DUF1176 domain-containing protein [Salmonella enterica subsp. diarizonae serovar 47:k:z35]EDQ3841932.1 DUF1176 domain-containing protein [Salmonella enterica 